MRPRLRKPTHIRMVLSNPRRLVNGNWHDLSSFKELPRDEQGVMFLKRVAFLFPRGKTFDPHKVPVEDYDGFDVSDGLAYGFLSSELGDANLYLLTSLWPEIARAGYVAEAPPRSGMYKVTAKGWAVVDND